MSFAGLLSDKMDVFRPVDPVEPAAGEDAAAFAHLKRDFQGEDDPCDEIPTASNIPCRLFEETGTFIVEGKQVTIIKSEVFCGHAVDVQNRDRIKVTPKNKSERTFDVKHADQVAGRSGPHHLELMVEEVA